MEPKLNSYFLILIFYLLPVLSFSQTEMYQKILSDRKTLDCEIMTLEIMNQIAEKFILRNYAEVDSLLNYLDFFCGKNETIERTIIFNTIVNNKQLEKKNIEFYLNNRYPTVLEHRKKDANLSKYELLYENYKDFYDYLPLRHPIDSIISTQSKELLNNDNISLDEKLFAILFANGNKEFSKAISKNEYKKSHTRAIINETKLQKSRNEPSFTLYTGVHSMIGNENRIFGNNIYVGASLSTPLKNRVIADFGMSIRFNANSNEFLFSAMDTIHTINPKSTLLFYSNVGYKVIDNKNIILIPLIGVGFESTITGLSELIEGENLDEDYYKYHNLNALNLAAGFTVLYPIFVRNYLGLSVKYHYCPYHWNKKLITKFDNSSVGCELLFRF